MRLLGYRRVLVVTAVEPERQAVLDGLGGAGDGVTVAVGGVGMAASAAATARLLALAAAGLDAGGSGTGTGGTGTGTGSGTGQFDAVLSVGVAGGVVGRAAIGDTVLATSSVAADLGADSPDGFLSLDRLGFGDTSVKGDAKLLTELSTALPAAVAGTVLTVVTVTGTVAGTSALLARHPDAIAEAMEGFGVATAAVQAGVPFGELRTISNAVGPRQRAGWRISEALTAITKAFAALAE